MTWDEGTINLLRVLWEEGHPTAEIGRRMGTTKNTIVGKAHRLDLPPRPSPIRRDGAPKPYPIRRLLPQRTIPLLPSEAPLPVYYGEWITPERIAILARDWPTHRPRVHIISDMTALPGGPMPQGHDTISTYAHGPLNLRRPADFRAAPVAQRTTHKAPVARPRPPRPTPVVVPLVAKAPAQPVFKGRTGACTWIDGDGPPWTACGAETDSGSSWCTDHVKRVFNGSRERLAGLQSAAD